MEQIKILIIDDDAVVCKQIVDLLNNTEIAGCKILIESESNFENGKLHLQNGNYDVVILDVYRGQPSETNQDLVGKEILEEIKRTTPIAVIFYTGLVTHVESLKSDIVRIVSKSTGSIENELKLLIETGIPLIRKKLVKHTQETLRDYYWGFVDGNTGLVRNSENKALSEYLFLRRLATTLTRNGMTKIFGNSISADKVHPLEFYVCPPIEGSIYETGDILKKDADNSFYVVLTPSCDFAQRKADYILLVSGTLLTEFAEYVKYQENRGNATNKENLVRLIESRKSDRYFFLPRNELIGMPDLVLDFQKVTSHPLVGFNGYEKIAKIDDPFAQDMLAMFVRNKNRPGSPDLDTNHVLKYLNEESEQTSDEGDQDQAER